MSVQNAENPGHITLTAKERETFRTLAMDARIAARMYDGSAAKYQHLNNLIQALEDFAGPKAETAGISVDDVIARLARDTRQAYDDGYSIELLREKAIIAMAGPRPDHPQGLLYLLKQVECLGVETVYTNGILTGQPSRAAYQPNLLLVFKALMDRGLTAQDTELTLNTAPSPSAYMMVSVPKLNAQIVLSNADGAPIYITKGPKDLTFWESATLSALANHPDIMAVAGTGIEDTYRQLQECLPREIVPYVHVPQLATSAQAATSGELTGEQIQARIAEFFKDREGFMARANEEALRRKPPEVQQAAAEAYRHKIIQFALKYADKNGCFPPYALATDTPATKTRMLEYAIWLDRHEGITLSTFINNWIKAQGKAYCDSHDGQYPDASSGTIATAGKKEIEWALIDACCMAATGRNITTLGIVLREDEPGHSERLRLERATRASLLSDLQDPAVILDLMVADGSIKPAQFKMDKPVKTVAAAAPAQEDTPAADDESPLEPEFLATAEPQAEAAIQAEVAPDAEPQPDPEPEPTASPLPVAAEPESIITTAAALTAGDAMSEILKHLIEQRAWLETLSDGRAAKPLINQWLAAQIGEAVAGPLQSHPDIDWSMVQDALLKDAADAPAASAVMTAPVVVPQTVIVEAVEEPAATPAPQPQPPATDDHKEQILLDILRYANDKGSLPSTNRDSDDDTTRKLWFRHNNWLSTKHGLTASGFLHQWLREKAEEYKAANGGQSPHAQSGPIAGYDMTWGRMDELLKAVLRKTYSLEIVLHANEPGHDERVAAETARRKGKAPKSAEAAQPAAEPPAAAPADTPLAQEDFAEVAAITAEPQPGPDLLLMLGSLKQRRFPARLGNGQPGSSLGYPWVMERVADFRKSHEGQNPTASSGPVDGYPDIDWHMIDDTIYATGRQTKIRLDRFIDKHNDTINRIMNPFAGFAQAQPATNKTNAPATARAERKPSAHRAFDAEKQTAIVADMLVYADKHKHFPSVNRASDTPAEQQLWRSHDNWLNRHLGFGIGEFIRRWTRQQDQAYQKDHGGAHAHAMAGEIKGYKSYDWALLDTCYRNYQRHFATSLQHIVHETDLEVGQSHGVKGKARFARETFASMTDGEAAIRWQGRYKYVMPEGAPTNRNDLAERMLAYAAQHGKFPSANDTDETAKTRAYWRMQEEWCLNRQNLSLSKFITKWTREKADEYRKDHGGAEPSTGPIKGFENYDWDVLRVAFSKRQLNPTLESIIAIDGDGYIIHRSDAVRMEDEPDTDTKAAHGAQRPAGWKPPQA